MSYCRFQNTLNDLLDCEEHIGELDDMSEKEFKAMIKLIRTCKLISKNNSEDIEFFEREFERIQAKEYD